MSHYLFELGLEEVPARFLLGIRDQLSQRIADFLAEKRIAYEEIESFATPRRIAVRIHNIADKQADIQEKVKGPALRIAQDDQGQWTKAAEGFARGQGASVEEIIVEDYKGEDYIYVDKFIAGQAVEEILKEIPTILQAMNFPVTMHWSNLETSFIRPVHWMVSLLDNQIIPFEFVGITSSNHTRGHRFLGSKDIVLEDESQYENALKKNYVIASFEERQAIIRHQVQEIAQENTWRIPMDLDLLEEITAIVEWPTAFYGEFESSYLEVPEIILQTAMKDHQRYFYVQDPTTEKMLPYFISVRNGNQEHLENVVKGNLKVLKARLEDALFFYQEDLKHSLNFFNEKLDYVNEHQAIGTYGEKEARVEALIQLIANQPGRSLPTGEAVEIAGEASRCYKFDLMTAVVDEFPELQGQMGEIYAEYYGLDDAVARAIGSQYLPNQAGGQLPATEAGALLAMADKLDTLIQFFEAGIIPTGSNDPFALRRQASGIVEIMLDRRWDFDLLTILHQKVLDPAVLTAIKEFIQARVSNHLDADGVDYDIIQSVTQVNHLDLLVMVDTAKRMQTLKLDDPATYRNFVEQLTRVVNLGHQVEVIQPISETLAQTSSEKALISQVMGLDLLVEQVELFGTLYRLAPTIEAYFEDNMVNTDDPTIKGNRQATLKVLTEAVFNLFDPRQLISKF
ncbi:glycine--tRNA ligase subunit beta [Hutsoniella sourekii]|uniref:glycine--tRNA ligase subunit beta n=1 Tax=Hutsoniella sourekii TaxID=87650 RepID=UPI0004801B7E|nr:glycine--tRNA ligase subunit beta [Hutsoniella sourekii]